MKLLKYVYVISLNLLEAMFLLSNPYLFVFSCTQPSHWGCCTSKMCHKSTSFLMLQQISLPLCISYSFFWEKFNHPIFDQDIIMNSIIEFSKLFRLHL